MELRTGHGRKLQGILEGRGETLGEWDVYSFFTPEEGIKRDPLIRGHLVEVTNVDHRLVLVHILGGSKKGGAGGRMQACYVCLLYNPHMSKFQYATMPNVSITVETADEELWKAIMDKFAVFHPATVSGAIQQAAKLTSSDSGEAVGKKRKRE